MATEIKTKEITSVLLEGNSLPLKVNFKAIKSVTSLSGKSVYEAIADQTPDAIIEKLKQALISGGNTNVTDEMCMSIIDDNPSVYGDIYKTYLELGNKYFSIVEVGNSTAPATEQTEEATS